MSLCVWRCHCNSHFTVLFPFSYIRKQKKSSSKPLSIHILCVSNTIFLSHSLALYKWIFSVLSISPFTDATAKLLNERFRAKVRDIFKNRENIIQFCNANETRKKECPSLLLWVVQMYMCVFIDSMENGFSFSANTSTLVYKCVCVCICINVKMSRLYAISFHVKILMYRFYKCIQLQSYFYHTISSSYCYIKYIRIYRN